MSTRLAVLVSLSLVASACGSELDDPTITLSPSDATLLKKGSTWFFVSPVQYSEGAASQDVRFAVRVKERQGGFLLVPSGRTRTFSGWLPPLLELPLDARGQFPINTQVVLTLEVLALNWDGVTNNGVAVRAQDYTFIAR